jgi:hypothetical protein
MSDYDLMEEGCEGCVRLLAKINELRIDLNNISMAPKTVLDAREGAFPTPSTATRKRKR